jgi:hypothetical protein
MSLNPYLQPLGVENIVHDYAHADRVFRTDAFRLHPKLAFLYYVRINLDPTYTMFKGLKQKEIGALVKTASLPKFTIDTKTLNAYNRVNLVQTKIKYDPVIIKFHDDAANIIREFWYDYYSFYYRDSDHATSLYQSSHKYNVRQTDKWGYTLRNSPDSGDKEQFSSVTQLITDIQIYSFHGKKFSEVTLHNPIITAFRHGEHDYAQGTGILEHEMQISYETVTYADGYLTEEEFGDDMLLKYDRTPSELSPQSLQQAGVSTVPGKGTDLTYQNGQVVRASTQTNYYRGGSIQAQNGFTQTAKSGGPQVKTNNSVFATAGKAVLGGMIQSAIRGRNPLSQFNVSNASNLLYQAGSAVGGPTGQRLIASGGLVRAGQSIMRNGVGPGNFGSVAVAVQALGQLGVRPENILSSGKSIFNGRATTNGSPVAQTQGTYTTVQAPNFPSVRPTSTVETSKTGIFSNPTYTDGNPNTINDSRNITPPSNQGRPGGGYGRFV